jgi:hypothetical protein
VKTLVSYASSQTRAQIVRTSKQEQITATNKIREMETLHILDRKG